MANQKITQLTAITGFPKTTDYFPVVTDVLTTPVTKKLQGYLNIPEWIEFEEAATYISATSFSIPGDYTSFIKIGARIRVTNIGSKYGYVLSSSYSAPNTTVNLIPNASYSLVSGAITGVVISYSDPPDFPGWLTYTATVSGESGSIGTYAETVYAQQFMISGRGLTVVVSKKISNVGSWAGNVQILLPAAISTETIGMLYGGILATGALAVKANPIVLASSSQMKFMKGWNSTYATWTDIAANDFILLRGTYRI